MIRLGIDTGGTYTDAVIVDTGGGEDLVPRVLAKAKALTTKDDLSRCILRAIDALPRDVLARAEQAALSTTLATNACVEGKGGRAKLIIVGTTDEVLRRVDAQGKFGIPYSDVLAVKYTSAFDGSDVVIPDWDGLYADNPAFFEDADSFGIASLYALNNGAAVEHSGAAWLRGRFGKLVVEATSVAAEPNVISRGATALLNARLVPVIEEFLDAIDEALRQRGLDIPVAIVRSDGTLMSEKLARIRPVETILSGPAASMTGARALARASECLIVDVGGTTSDISIVHGGRSNRTDGILIGGWKTQVAGVSIDTIALGGDTVVRFTKNSCLELGTRKVTPLCIAAARWPQVTEALKHYLARACADFHSRYELLYLLRDPGDVERFTGPEQRLVELLREGPLSLFDERADIVGLKPQRLEGEGIVMRCGMTPTDAMHLRGDFGEFDAAASRLGAQCLLKSYRGLPEADEDAIGALADEIYDLAQQRLFAQVAGALMRDRYWPDSPVPLDVQMRALVEDTWRRRPDPAPSEGPQRLDGRVEGPQSAPGQCNELEESPLVPSEPSSAPFNLRFECRAALVGVGAPTHVFLPEVAHVLGAEGIVPEHAEVANAVGAAVSHVTVEQKVKVNPQRGADGVVRHYQVCGTGSAEQFDSSEEALAAARELARTQALAEARRRGAQGDLDCVLEETRNVFTSTGVMELLRDWTITARVL